jgi:hypothetical protein
MELIIRHSAERAAAEAAKLWSLAIAQYPKENSVIRGFVVTSVIETVSAFALNARRALEALPRDRKFGLTQAYWTWTPTEERETVQDLWDALNRIIHAKKLLVGLIDLPDEMTKIVGGAVVVPNVVAETDRKELAYIDPFALSYAFLYNAYPLIAELTQRSSSRTEG